MHRLDKPVGRVLPTFAASIVLTLTLATGARADGPANPGCNCPPAKTVHRAVTRHVWHPKTYDVWTQGQVRWGWNAEYDARYGDVPVHYPNPPYRW